MSDSPASNTMPSQKRPLEEPSSPSGPGDQPDAKRPNIGKTVKPETPEATSAIPSVAEDSKPEKDMKTERAETQPQTQPVPSLPSVDNGNTNGVKHSLPGSGRTQPTSGNGPTDESAFIHIRAIISSAEAATVIGKGGENVTQIRAMSGAKCTVSDYTRGAIERILTVSGLVDAVAKAFGLIIRTLNNEPLSEASSPQSKTYPLRLLVPHILIGSIIGKAGVRIREIQDASGARLNVSESCLPLSTERSLVILGVADAVHIAAYYVGSTLVEQLNERFGGPSASAYATRSGGPAGSAPGGLQVVPYVPQAAGGQWGHPESFRRGNNNTQRTPSNPYGMQYMQGQQGQHQQPAAAQGQMHYNAGSPRAANAYAGAGPHHPQQQYGQPAQGPQVGAGPQGQAQIPGQPLTQQIFIPNDMVGAIIGKGGAKINEIRQLSGSVIKINEPQDNSNERLVTITGTQECNQMALYMLYSRLESEKHRI